MKVLTARNFVSMQVDKANQKKVDKFIESLDSFTENSNDIDKIKTLIEQLEKITDVVMGGENSYKENKDFLLDLKQIIQGKRQDTKKIDIDLILECVLLTEEFKKHCFNPDSFDQGRFALINKTKKELKQKDQLNIAEEEIQKGENKFKKFYKKIISYINKFIAWVKKLIKVKKSKEKSEEKSKLDIESKINKFIEELKQYDANNEVTKKMAKDLEELVKEDLILKCISDNQIENEDFLNFIQNNMKNNANVCFLNLKAIIPNLESQNMSIDINFIVSLLCTLKTIMEPNSLNN